eukprot:SAG31_NODE_240_length_19407_cov_29.686140_8_plen_48_part_00
MCVGALAQIGYNVELEMVTACDKQEVADMIAAVNDILGVKKPTVKLF